MRGSAIKFIKYMEGSDKRFVVPVYQRNYDWRTENCKQLFDDLVRIVKRHRRSHFFGSLVSYFNHDGEHEEFLVIDGQQRLTTVSLLLLAMHDLMKQGIIKSRVDTLQERIFEEYLVDKWQKEDTRIKLKPIKNDQKAYGKLFEDTSEHIHGSNLTVNYEYFYNRIQKQEITIDELYDAICRLEIINIQLDDDDNPQLIFESLNSTGLDLSEGDKIRNYILMGLPSKQQEEYYDKYWNKIEACTKYDVGSFIRDYLSIKQQAIPQQKKVYTNFKDYTDSGEFQVEPLLKELLAYARRYQTLLEGKTSYPALNACIYRLNRLETTVTRPFFLEVLRLYDEKKLTVEQVTDIFLTTESYLFRRNICDLPTNSLNKIFLMLHREIIRYDESDTDYVEKFKYTFLSKKDRVRFPDDEEFAEAFTRKPIYLANSKNKVYLLERLENYGTAEDKDIYRHCDEGTYSIEHIMPQHLTPTWQKELGPDYKQIHEEWLHRIANLTLTAYNSKYSNRSFTEKKTMQNGFEDSGIRMNTWIAKKDIWSLKELEERSQYLGNRALTIWKKPSTDYIPEEKQLESYSLDDDADFTGRQIMRFTFKQTDQPVNSWSEMYQKIIQILYAQDNSAIKKLAFSDEDPIASHFSADEMTFSKSAEISDGIYVWTNNNTKGKLSVLNRLFKLYNEDPSGLIFYLKDESDLVADVPGSRAEQRRRYWTYALPVIKQAQGDDGIFHNVNPTSENWINGYFGMRGVSICCVANSKGARVELYLQRNEKAENKKLYDILVSHKVEIERATGMPLIWERADDRKMSKISIQNSNVSSETEADWPKMAQFQAEWSKRFYDILVPFITAK